MADAAQVDGLPNTLLLHIFGFLGPQDLLVASACCRLWHRLATSDLNKQWAGFYRDRWRVVQQGGHQHGIKWCSQFSSQMQKIGSWTGKWRPDDFYGHKSGVRAVKLCGGLLATGSLDRTVRLWDLSSGLPLACSKPHRGTVRCVALDESLLVSGSTDHTIRLFYSSHTFPTPDLHLHTHGDRHHSHLGSRPRLPSAQTTTSSQSRPSPFDLSEPHAVLKGHTGPVSSLCLLEHALYSGSWDCTVHTYMRYRGVANLEASSVYTYNDWVSSVAARGKNLIVAAGPDIYCHDLATGQGLHEGNVACVEGTQNSRLLFSAGPEGKIMATDLRMKKPSCAVWHNDSGILGLSFEDPWLAAASADGSVLLLNTEAQSHALGSARPFQSTSCRRLHAAGGAVYCVDIGDQSLACGSEADRVRVFDFSGARAAADRAAAAKATRNSRKHGRVSASSAGPEAWAAPAQPHTAVESAVASGASFAEEADDGASWLPPPSLMLPSPERYASNAAPVPATSDSGHRGPSSHPAAGHVHNTDKDSKPAQAMGTTAGVVRGGRQLQPLQGAGVQRGPSAAGQGHLGSSSRPGGKSRHLQARKT